MLKLASAPLGPAMDGDLGVARPQSNGPLAGCTADVIAAAGRVSQVFP